MHAPADARRGTMKAAIERQDDRIINAKSFSACMIKCFAEVGVNYIMNMSLNNMIHTKRLFV